MTAYNVVRFRVKPGMEDAFIASQRKSLESDDLPGAIDDEVLLDGGRVGQATRLRKAYLGKIANGKEVLLALQAVLPPPQLAAGGLDQQEQAPAVRKFPASISRFGRPDLRSVSRLSDLDEQ